MSSKPIPNYTISKILQPDASHQQLVAMRLEEYLAERSFLFHPHRHDFYHLVFFTKASGHHSIDFENFTIHSGQIYLMMPGQVHNWQFDEEPTGFIINFSPSFFKTFLQNTRYLEQFKFYSGHFEEQVIALTESEQEDVVSILQKIIEEANSMRDHSMDMIRSLLIQLFILVNRQASSKKSSYIVNPGYQIVWNFQKLVDEHFMEKKLPREYASMLNITPDYLNKLSREQINKSAGEVIRERVILEAKRLLVNANLTVSEIAYQLNFRDNSYFTKVFKKLNGTTPEEFRKNISYE
jgi:AraC family transcriptional activator of pobA